MRLAGYISRLFRVQSFCNQVLRIRFNIFFEEEACKGDAVIQGNESFADEWRHFEQGIIIDFESHVGEIWVDPPSQVLNREETDVCSVKVVQFLEVDCSR